MMNWKPRVTLDSPSYSSTSSMRYHLVPVPGEDWNRWDDVIVRYHSRTLFHRRAWLDYLAASRGVRIRAWAIHQGMATVGYFVGGELRKGPFRIFGSPLKGWGTNFLGPVSDAGMDQLAFLQALEDLAIRERWAMLEIENPILSEDAMQTFGFDSEPQPTFVVELTPDDPERMWNRMQQRSEVRKAMRNGLVVEDTHDAGIADEYYDQFVDVLQTKGTFPPYDRRCPRLLFDFLKPRDQLFALRVRGPGGSIIATGLFPHDAETVYFWGGAGRLDSRKLSPHDLMHWSVMEMAAKRGLRTYNMCGNGFFKSKFGGALVAPKRWHKYFWRSANWARQGYAVYYRRLLSMRGWLHRVGARGRRIGIKSLM